MWARVFNLRFQFSRKIFVDIYIVDQERSIISLNDNDMKLVRNNWFGHQTSEAGVLVNAYWISSNTLRVHWAGDISCNCRSSCVCVQAFWKVITARLLFYILLFSQALLMVKFVVILTCAATSPLSLALWSSHHPQLLSYEVYAGVRHFTNLKAAAMEICL